jgi:D-alanyl-D-alanine carboxypeptidase/D-alanyl-D-alanine-endopeptidase (penicillin-binding protein 4)
VDDTGQTDLLTVHNPAGLFVALFKEALARRGVRISGRVRTLNWLDRQAAPLVANGLVELGAVESPPLGEIVREIEKPSQNLYTDLLLAHIGATAQATNAPGASETSEEAGIRELNRFLAEAGIDRAGVRLEEGSGLSRNNLTTPDATVRLLEFMSRHRWAEAYRDALPIAGVDGTLRSRMKDTPAAGNVRAKTGTLRWANSLSGYVTTAAGERLAFSIMLNRYSNPDPQRPTRSEIDAIPVMLAGLTWHSSKAGE